MATSFNVNKADLEFILKQISIAELHAGGATLTNAIGQIYGLSATDAALVPFGLRTVDGTFNNLLAGQEEFGAADTLFPRLLDPVWRTETDGDSINLGPGGIITDGNYLNPGDIADADPRTISNLIVNQTVDNPAAVQAWFNNPLSLARFEEDHPGMTPVRPGELTGAPNELEISNDDIANIPNQSPDIGLSPGFNAWMTFFGQFFDHGLDLVTKGNNGTVYIPLEADDPLVAGADGIFGNADDLPAQLRFMALTRADVTDVGGVPQAENTTTPFVDQNQTYTSNASHHVFLREYERITVDGQDITVSTGHLLDGTTASGSLDGALANWGEVKAQAATMLGIQLSDFDVHSAPMLKVDQYGNFIAGENGYAQVAVNVAVVDGSGDLVSESTVFVEGVDGGLDINNLTIGNLPASFEVPLLGAGESLVIQSIGTNHQFLVDIAHHAAPGMYDSDGDHIPDTLQTADTDNGVSDDNDPTTYDDEMLAAHYVTGDGRGNENIALTTVHSVFHAEHNRLVETYKDTIVESGDLAFLNEWLLVSVDAIPADPGTLVWDGDRLFQAGRFVTEMQYQHLVFEEFARAIQPNVDPFVFTNDAQIDASIIAEFAHTVYRFGHSMLNDTVDRIDNDLVAVNNPDTDEQATLIEAFLNPQMFAASGADIGEVIGNIARGATLDVGNEIDELVVPALQSNLLGLPLDLAALNIARGRETGIPSLNETREQLYNDFGLADLKPYTSWIDFAQHIKNPASIINFVAAYGTHETITAETTIEGKRAAAAELFGFEQTISETANITNASFEGDDLSTPGVGGVIGHPLGNYTVGNPTDWTISGTGGVFLPAAAAIGAAGHEGGNVAWVSGGATLSRDTGTVLAEGANYTLSVNLGDRIDQGGTFTGAVRLVASDNTVLATLNPTPVDGAWTAVTLDSGAIAAAQAGQTLRIEIQNTGGNQILVDNVGVTASGLPFNGEGMPADAAAFLNATGAYTADLGGLNLVDLWIGGLAEEKNEFGGFLGSTFNFVFEYQLEHLQTGDRFYYLSRTQGTNLLNQLEPNTFTDIVMRNSSLGDDYATHLSHAIFQTPDHIFELDRGIAQADYNEANGASQADGGFDPTHDDPFLQAIDPKVVRIEASVVGDHTVGGTLKYSGGEHVVLGGTEGNDILIGDKGIDSLWGDGGNDYLNGGSESDHVFGGAGDDIIEDPFGDDFLRGEDGNDVISAGSGLDLLFGGAGKDYLIFGQDDKEGFGDEGDDFILGGTGNDFLLGGEDDDWIEGGEGFDVIAGENSELFFNSPIIGHDVMWGQGGDQDYDSESGDDIMLSGPGIQRFEGMFGFDWAISKYDPGGADFDFQIPIFVNTPANILRDRFDLVEGGSGWMHSDVIDGDDRGHSGGSSSPDSSPEARFGVENVLYEDGIDRIDGLRQFLGDQSFGGTGPIAALETLFGAGATTYRDGNMLMGGGGDDFLRGRGGYDIIDGDAWLNVRIRIEILEGPNAGIYSAESLNTDTSVAGPYAGKVYNTDDDGNPVFGSVAFGGASLNSLMLNRTINPGELHIVREVLSDDNHYGADGVADRFAVDTAFFQGTFAEYTIEGSVDLNGDGDTVDDGEFNIFDVNGDGFISVRDNDNGVIGATVDGVTLGSRGALTDDTDLIRNIELLQFADQTIQIGNAGGNTVATGLVTIQDATPFELNGETIVSPIVGEVLTATLTNVVDPDVPVDANGTPLAPYTFEWQTTETGSNAGWATIQTSDTYTVRDVDPGHVLRAVAVFQDDNGVPERITSDSTDNVTAPFNVAENSAPGTLVAAAIPFSVDYDPLGFGNNGVPVDADVTTLYHVLVDSAGGRFEIVGGVGAQQIVVGPNGGPSFLDFEDPANPDHRYELLIETYSDTPANGGVLITTRQFTVQVGDVAEGPTGIVWNGVEPGNNDMPLAGAPIADLSVVDQDGSGPGLTFSTTSTAFNVTSAGQVSASANLGNNTTTTFDVVATDAAGSTSQTFNVRTGNNLTGNADSDIIYARNGADVVNGAGGNDVLYGQGGADTLNGGDGNDALYGGAGSDELNGGAGNDILIGGAGGDIIDGGAGDDTIIWNANASGATDGNGNNRDLVNGGGDTDTFVVNGRAGEAETFRIFSRDAAIAAGATEASLDAATEIVVTRGNGNGANGFDGRIIAELTNIDEIIVNTLETTADNGNGVVDGGVSQGDTIEIFGDFSGTDLDFNTITINGSMGNDTVDISAIESPHRILFRSMGGNDTIVGNLRPQDVIELPDGASPSDYGAPVYDAATGMWTLTSLDGTHSVTYAGAPDMAQPELIEFGTPVPDLVDTPATEIGTSTAIAAGVIAGTDPTLMGTDDADIIRGADANTSIHAGGGADIVSTGDGDAVVMGGAGNDIIETGAGSDVVFGDGGRDTIITMSGNDKVWGGGGDDLIDSGEGNDLVFGGAGNDEIDAGAGNDRIWAGDGEDLIMAGAGDDRIEGGAGSDVMFGDAGNDTFVFRTATDADGDTIADFQAGDRIDLHFIDGSESVEGNNAFTLTTGAQFTAEGQLIVRFDADRQHTVIEGNTDADTTTAEFTVIVEGDKVDELQQNNSIIL